MKSILEIQSVLDIQNLYEKCKFDTEEEQQFFYGVTTVNGIQNRIIYLQNATETKSFPIYYITYESDEFRLNINWFDKLNEEIVCTQEQQTELKWVLAFKKQYILTYPNGMKMGTVFKQKLPVITII